MTDFSLRDIARVCHEANRELQVILGEQPNEAWDDCDVDLQESAVVGVGKALEGVTSEELHESWCVTKRQQGWVYGEEKDFDAKTHPCLVPYAELPLEQRVKDDLFKAIVRALGGMSL